MKETELYMAVNDRGKVMNAPVLWIARAWAEETSRRTYLLFRHNPADAAVRRLIGGGRREAGRTVILWVRLGAQEMKRALERASVHRRRAA